jgi:tetrahydromethanopterin S-methyltransferase subunit G
MTKKPITTIEDLAALIYETMASKEDVGGVRGNIKALEDRVNTRFDSVESRLDHLNARVGRIEADVHALRDEMVHRQEFQDVLDRVKYIEKKLGIESGV